MALYRNPLNSILGSQKMPLNLDIKMHSGKTPQKTFYFHVLDGVLTNALKRFLMAFRQFLEAHL